MSKSQKDLNVVPHTTELNPKLLTDVRKSIVVIRDIPVITDADVANLYGVETKRVNEAVRNNPDKFPEDYMFVLSLEESDVLRSKFSTTKVSSKSRTLPKVFTEKGLYMLATILKSKNALNVTMNCCNCYRTDGRRNDYYYHILAMAAYSNERVAAIVVSVLYRMLTLLLRRFCLSVKIERACPPIEYCMNFIYVR